MKTFFALKCSDIFTRHIEERRSEDMSKVTMKQIKIYWVLPNQIGISPATFEPVLASRGSAFSLVGETRSRVLISKVSQAQDIIGLT